MIWDTTQYFLKYDNFFKKIYVNKINTSRKNFFSLIQKISSKNKNIDWWVSPVGERNNYSTDLFHYLCLIESINHLYKNNILVECIILDNRFLFKILKKKYPKFEFKLKQKKKNYSIINILFKQAIIFIFSKIYKKKYEIEKFSKNIILVDKFVTSTNLSDDRYYNNFYKHQDNAIYLPTFANLKIIEIIKVLKKISSDHKFLNKFDFLSTREFLFSFFYFLRKKKLFVNNFYYKNMNLSDLINNQIDKNDNLNASMLGIQNFLFTKKISESKIKINKIINWFENTAIDKGLNYGSNIFLKDVENIGYQGFTSYKEFMCIDPLDYEKKNKLLPKKIICIGKNLINSRKEFCKNLNISVGPALRFEHVYKKIKRKKKLKNSVLVNLNLEVESSELIIQNILKTDFYNSFNGKIYIKSHPFLNMRKKLNLKNYKNIYFLNGNIFQIASKFNVAVSSGSTSSIIETIVAGCRVCFPFDNFTDAYSLKLIKTPKKYYKVCKSIKELSDYLLNNTNNDSLKNKKKIMNFKKNIFNKPNSNNILSIK